MNVSFLAFLSFTIVSIHAHDEYSHLPTDMREFMDEKVAPCDDFYAHVCGGWLKNNKIPQSHKHIDSSTMVINNRIDKIIMNEKPPVIRELWESCMTSDHIAKIANQPLEKDMARIYNAKSTGEVMELAGEFARTGGNAFFKFTVGPDPYTSSQNTLFIRPKLTLPKLEYYSKDQFAILEPAYTTYIDELMYWASVSEPGTRKRKRGPNTKIVQNVIAIEKHLADLQHQVGDSLYPLTIGEAKLKWPNSFYMYMKGMGLITDDGSKNNVVIHLSFQYFHLIETILNKGLPLENLKGYILFVMVHSRARWLDQNFDRVWWNFFRNFLKKQRHHLPRDRVCRNILREHLPDLVGQVLYKETFDRERNEITSYMIKLIREAMEGHINHSPWLDGQTEKEEELVKSLREALGEPSIHPTDLDGNTEKGKAYEKLHKLRTLIGLPKHPRSYPPAYMLSRVDYPKNMYTILSHSFDEEMKKIGQTRDPEEWTVSPVKPNAHYLPDRNTLVLPVGVLQPPYFYGPNVHPARNFGAIGAIMGHELIHAFDAKGSRYDADGNEFPWWDPTRPDYAKGAKCFEQQYSGFKIKGSRKSGIEDNGQNMNGLLTLDENIADNGGLALAWDAYRKYILNGFPHTSEGMSKLGDKLFFITYGQMFCGKARDLHIEYDLLWNKCSPGQWRVNGVVMNNKKFAEVFECKPVTPMNPSKKCVLW